MALTCIHDNPRHLKCPHFQSLPALVRQRWGCWPVNIGATNSSASTATTYWIRGLAENRRFRRYKALPLILIRILRNHSHDHHIDALFQCLLVKADVIAAARRITTTTATVLNRHRGTGASAWSRCVWARFLAVLVLGVVIRLQVKHKFMYIVYERQIPTISIELLSQTYNSTVWYIPKSIVFDIDKQCPGLLGIKFSHNFIILHHFFTCVTTIWSSVFFF